MQAGVTAGPGDFCAHLKSGQMISSPSYPVITANGTLFPFSFAITGLFLSMEAAICSINTAVSVTA